MQCNEQTNQPHYVLLLTWPYDGPTGEVAQPRKFLALLGTRQRVLNTHWFPNCAIEHVRAQLLLPKHGATTSDNLRNRQANLARRLAVDKKGGTTVLDHPQTRYGDDVSIVWSLVPSDPLVAPAL